VLVCGVGVLCIVDVGCRCVGVLCVGVGVLVCWCVGVGVCWCVGVLVRWCVGVGVLVCWCVLGVIRCGVQPVIEFASISRVSKFWMCMHCEKVTTWWL
jgi:hypothetical protein